VGFLVILPSGARLVFNIVETGTTAAVHDDATGNEVGYTHVGIRRLRQKVLRVRETEFVAPEQARREGECLGPRQGLPTDSRSKGQESGRGGGIDCTLQPLDLIGAKRSHLSDTVSRSGREGLEGKRMAGADGVWSKALRIKGLWIRSPVLGIAAMRRQQPSLACAAFGCWLRCGHPRRHSVTAARRRERC
jgi:hypothetical protein